MFPPVSVAEVVKLIESAPSKTSPLDIMQTSIMKAFQEDVAVMIANVANISLRMARFPPVHEDRPNHTASNETRREHQRFQEFSTHYKSHFILK